MGTRKRTGELARERKTVCVRLTVAQARALWFAAGNSLDADCDAVAVLGNVSTVRAGRAGRARLGTAVARAGGFAAMAAQARAEGAR